MAVFCVFRIFASAKFFIILPDNHTAHAREIKQLIAFYGCFFIWQLRFSVREGEKSSRSRPYPVAGTLPASAPAS